MLHQILYRSLFAIVLCSLSLPFLPTPTTAQLANQVLMLDLANRRYEGTTYYAEIWVIMMPNKEWPVCHTVIWMEFNLNTLDATPFNGAALFDFDPELSNAGYVAHQQFVGGLRQALTIDVLSPDNNFVTKYGGSNGTSFRLGTVRWTSNGGGKDGLMFVDEPPLKETKIFYHNPSNNDCEVYDGEEGRGRVFLNMQESLYINAIGCSAPFFDRRTWCGDELREIDTDYPLTIISPHWPAIPGPGGQIHQARYQYDFRPANMPSWEPLFVRGFNTNDVPILADRARCRWEAQIDQLSPPPATNNFEWMETTTGGRFYFTRDSRDINPDPFKAYTILGLTKTAFSSTNGWMISDTSSCGVADSWFNRSEIVFNGSDILHTFKPHLRWTTNLAICGDGPDCIDFYTIALHEIGHYLGLAHQLYNHNLVMSKSGVWPMQDEMTLCDAENIRRLYNPSRINAPVDNSYDCSKVTTVLNSDYRQSLTDSFYIIGEPNDYSVVYKVSSPSNVEIDVCNSIGQKIFPVFYGMQQIGEYTLQLPVSSLATGIYFVRLKTDVNIKTHMLPIVK